MSAPTLSICIPTFRREDVLVDTIGYLRGLDPSPIEIIVVDQTPTHEPAVAAALADWDRQGTIRHVKVAAPSITHAMNTGLVEARGDIVLFLDDDIRPEAELIEAHLTAHREAEAAIVAGRVLQPWHRNVVFSPDEPFHFASTTANWVEDFMGGNVSMRRDAALRLGGFDENFVCVAYNFEAEFAYRARQAGLEIYYEPRACIHHLKIAAGGTRSFGEHLTTAKPDHAVGAYYFLIRRERGITRLARIAARFLRSAMTRHHVRRPWYIPVTLVAQARGLAWALRLAAAGPRLLDPVPRHSAR